MSLYHFFIKKKFYLHLLVAIGMILLMAWTTLSMLDRYTRHGEVYIVPEFFGEDHQEIIERYNEQFRFIISDSIYKVGVEPGAILQQDPLPGAKVKQGRNVYFIVVARQPEKVLMPNLLNLSIRQALVTIESSGLIVSNISFTDHFARNAVVAQQIEGEPVEPGTLIFRGSEIDLILGDGGDVFNVPFPMIYGKKPKEARDLLHHSTLNVGNENFLDDADTTDARVYKTEPFARPGQDLKPGTIINVWYRSQKAINFDTFINDSLFIEDTTNTTLNHEIIEEENL